MISLEKKTFHELKSQFVFSIFRYNFFKESLGNKFFYYYFTERSNKTRQRAICMPILQSNNATSSIYEKTYYDTYWGETIFVWILRLLLYSENSSQFTYSKKPLKYLHIVLKRQQNKLPFFLFCKCILVLIILQYSNDPIRMSSLHQILPAHFKNLHHIKIFSWYAYLFSLFADKIFVLIIFCRLIPLLWLMAALIQSKSNLQLMANLNFGVH